jgi:hypothetical protein
MGDAVRARAIFLTELVWTAVTEAEAHNPPNAVMIGTTLYERVAGQNGAYCMSPNTDGDGNVQTAMLFQRNGTGNAQLTIPPIFDSNNQGNWVAYINGPITLVFKTSTSGNIREILSPGSSGNSGTWMYQYTAFSGYSQKYDSQKSTLDVKFTIEFPDCSLPFEGIFQG